MKTLTAKSAKKCREGPRACRKEIEALKEESRAFAGAKSYRASMTRFKSTTWEAPGIAPVSAGNNFGML